MNVVSRLHCSDTYCLIVIVIMLTITGVGDIGLTMQSSLLGRKLTSLHKRSLLTLVGSLYMLFNLISIFLI